MLLDVQEVRKSYVSGDTIQPVLKGLSFRVRKGEFLALLGPSGSGKSTLLSIVGTLLRPTSGHIHLLGFDLTTATDDELTMFRNKHIGFVFQYHHLLPDFSALENVMFPSASAAGREEPAMVERAADLLTRVGLADRANYKATKLSGGQKQRVAIARALMNKPAMVLADEPTGNLDRESAASVMKLLSQMNAERQTTFFISTHDPEIAEYCGRRITLLDGRLSSIEDAAP
jgi:lipoprotein-releasing system ATP-binding protein